MLAIHSHVHFLLFFLILVYFFCSWQQFEFKINPKNTVSRSCGSSTQQGAPFPFPPGIAHWLIYPVSLVSLLISDKLKPSFIESNINNNQTSALITFQWNVPPIISSISCFSFSSTPISSPNVPYFLIYNTTSWANYRFLLMFPF